MSYSAFAINNKGKVRVLAIAQGSDSLIRASAALNGIPR
jgi:hypothetical protein